MKFFFFLIIAILTANAWAIDLQPTNYPFTDEPIDVVIPCCEKDLVTLDLCIDGIKKNGINIRRIIVISDKQLTDQAEWFDENDFPFSKHDVAVQLFKGDSVAAEKYLSKPNRVGWYYQQVLKFYSPFIIPEISSNVLILDSDTIFLKPTKFLGDLNGGLYNPGTENKRTYFDHMKKFLPGLRKVFQPYSGISHHMLFQRPVLEDLFNCVEIQHGMPLWQAFCRCVSLNDISAGASEYEIYFNFVFTKTKQVKIRQLKWQNFAKMKFFEKYKREGWDYISCHDWYQNK